MDELPLKNLYAKKRRPADVILNAVIIAIIVAILIQLVFYTCFSRVYVVGDSMLPTLTGAADRNTVGGDYVFISSGTPEYGDIVVINPHGSGEPIIKRVIATGGDTLYLDEGVLYIKYSGSSEFVVVEESYLSDENNDGRLSVNTYPKENGALNREGHTVSDGCIFVMGDNRNISHDSRSADFGDFPISSVVGIVTDWSLSSAKPAFTAWYTFWDFTLPSLFS